LNLSKSIPFLILPLALTGCFSEDKPQPELQPFLQEISTVRERDGQVYYNLRDRKIKRSNSIYSWDLAFNCQPGKFDIVLNSAKKMGVSNTGSIEFDIHYQTEHKYYQWQYDHPSGSPEKNAFGTWGDFTFENPQSYRDVYIINRGFDKFNLPFRLKKFKINGFNDNEYHVSFADADGDNIVNLSIPKNDSFNYVYVSLDKVGSVYHLEPPKDDWDIMVTNYIDTTRYRNVYTKSDSINDRYTLFDGILLNPYNHGVAIDTNGFNSIGFFDVGEYTYMNNKNFIGNQWYDWDEVNRKYRLSSTNTFVVKHGRLNYYVLEFRDVDKPRRDELKLNFAIKNL
jgi:hypothetical protein